MFLGALFLGAFLTHMHNISKGELYAAKKYRFQKSPVWHVCLENWIILAQKYIVILKIVPKASYDVRTRYNGENRPWTAK